MVVQSRKLWTLFSAPEERKNAKKNIFTFVLRKLYFPSLTAPTIPTCVIMVILTWYNMARLPSSGSPCVELALILQGTMDFSSETVRALRFSLVGIISLPDENCWCSVMWGLSCSSLCCY